MPALVPSCLLAFLRSHSLFKDGPWILARGFAERPGGKPRWDLAQGPEAHRGRVAMIGVGAFELGVGLLLAALILYFVFRNQA